MSFYSETPFFTMELESRLRPLFDSVMRVGDEVVVEIWWAFFDPFFFLFMKVWSFFIYIIWFLFF